ncbi:uncharacterized protein LOC126371175 isoform X2 [Pectinophora gossypiella]|uniref:uncharacterized protein LOC126371175 isoform X2 n=1 Tax=Pectinophora gossypiella TaxID=13191 RepID=UPI00214DFEB9|nr:uncharacterized protein LOC126371175 isoform X2 [Pectinophora gossypiella]
MPGEMLHLASTPEAWRKIVCSCTDCDSYNCFALRHEAAAGCTCKLCEHSKTCLFYNKVKTNLNAPLLKTPQAKTPQVKTPKTFSYQDTGTSTPKCNMLHNHTEDCSKKFHDDCNTKNTLIFYENIKARLEEAQAAIKDIKSRQESKDKSVPQILPTETLKSPPNITPQPSPDTLPKAFSETPSQIKKKTTPGDPIPYPMRLESLKACSCKISKSCPYYKKDKQQVLSEPGQVLTNNTCSSYLITKPNNKIESSETVANKKYRVVPIVDSDRTDYIKVESTETYNIHKSDENAPKTEKDNEYKNTIRIDKLVLSNSEMKQYEKIIEVLKYILEQNQEKSQNAKQKTNVNHDTINKKHTDKKSKVDKVTNVKVETNIDVEHITDKPKSSDKNINDSVKTAKKSQTKKDEHDIIDNGKHAFDSVNITKKEKITNNHPDNNLKKTSSKCKNKFCTLEGHKPFKKRIELQIVYDIRGNDKFSSKSDEVETKPNQNVSYSCSHTKTSAELSAQIMNVPFREYTKYISKPEPAIESTPKQKGSKYILKKIKDIYEACSCKVCECISSIVPANPTTKSEVCNCKPCDCDECQGYGKGSTTSEKCNCRPCECIECTSAKLSGSCACKACECIECKYSNIKKYRKYIVAPVGENQQRRYCDCSPCGCYECAHPYGTVSNRTTQETSTEVRRHLNCHCHPCNNVDCEQDGADTCTCDRHSKVMSKPVLKDTQEYDIHHVTVSNLGRNAYKCKKLDKGAAAWLFSTTPKQSSKEDNTKVANAICAQFGCRETETYVLPSAFQSKIIKKRDGKWLFSAADSNEESSHNSNAKVIDPVSTQFGSREIKISDSVISKSAYQNKKNKNEDAKWLFLKQHSDNNVLDALCKRFGCNEPNQIAAVPGSGNCDVYQPDLHLHPKQKISIKKDNEIAEPDDGCNDKVSICEPFGCKEVVIHDSNIKIHRTQKIMKRNSTDSKLYDHTRDDNDVNELNNGEHQNQDIDKDDAAWLFSAVRNQNSNRDDNSNVSDELCSRFGGDDTIAVALNLTRNFPTAKYFAKVNNSGDCDCKPCKCPKCLKHYKEGHNPKERMKNCYCEICECINCESMLCDTSVCDCKPCGCSECQKFLPSRLRTYGYRRPEYTSKNKKSVYPCMNDSSSRYLTLLKAKQSDRFLDKIITDKESKNFYHSYTEPNHKTKPQVDMYCEITSNNKNINRSHRNINKELIMDRANPSVLKDKIHDYVSRKKTNITKVTENTNNECYKEKQRAMKNKNDESITRESSSSFEPSTSGLTHDKEISDLKNRNTKSKESSCNSSGYDNSNYLIRFPKSTVETCISDVMNLSNYKKSAFTPLKPSQTKPESEYKTSTISEYLHNTVVLKDKYPSVNHNSSKQGVIKISNLKMCENFNSESPCGCQPCDCDKCLYKTIKYDRCRCDCNNCFCYGTCLSEDKSVYIRKNELTQTLELQDSGEVSLHSAHNINPETKTLVKQFYPAWNTQELEVSRDKDIQPKDTNKNSTDDKCAIYKNDNCVINSCGVNINYYDSVQHTLRDAKAFSLELLKILQKYEKANKDFDSVSKKFKELQETRLNDDVVVDKEESSNSEVTEKIQPIENDSINNENDSTKSQFHIYPDSTNKIETVESVTSISLQTVPINISSNFVDNKNERNKILTDIYDLNGPEIVPLITPDEQCPEQENSNVKVMLTSFKDTNHVQENNDMKVKLDSLKNQYKMYSKLISRAIIKCKKEKWKKTCSSGSHSKSASPDNSRNCYSLIQNNGHDENVSLLNKETKDEIKKDSNYKLNTVYLNTVDPRDLDSVSTDKILVFENNENLFANSNKESFLDKNQLTTSNNVNVSYPNLALEKEDALIDIPARLNTNEAIDCVSQDENVYQKMSFSKGYYNIMNKDIEEASTSQDETLRAEFQRRFESMPSVPQTKGRLLTGIDSSIEKIASSNIMKTTSSYDPKKVAFQTVRKVSDHTILVKWKVPLITTDIEGYELLLNGRSVQKMLSPTHNMAVVTCLPHTNKVLLTVRTITLASATTGNYPTTTVVYRLRSK